MIVHLENPGQLPGKVLFKTAFVPPIVKPLRRGEEAEPSVQIQEHLAVKITPTTMSGKTVIYMDGRIIYYHFTTMGNQTLWITIENLFEEKYNAKVKRIIP